MVNSRKLLWKLLIPGLYLLFSAAHAEQDLSAGSAGSGGSGVSGGFESGAGIDSSIESLEQELMSLNADLLILEEDLLYPASSRIAVYLSMDVGELFRLDAVTVKLNGKKVAHHLYTERQLDAILRGGVQQLYVGNARQGANKLTAVFVGEGPHERDYKRAASVTFEQSFEPVYIELGITGSTATQQPEFSARVH